MRRILRSPAVNAACLCLFTAFYAAVFFATNGGVPAGELAQSGTAWAMWKVFLAAGGRAYIAVPLMILTALAAVLLIKRRHPYDEYHVAILTGCLAVSAVLTLIAIAIFYAAMLCDPSDMIDKFTLFIAIHWTSVVLADLTYILMCGRER